MKYRYVAIAASVATGVSAQDPYSVPAVSSSAVAVSSSAAPVGPFSYTTVTYDDCPSQSVQSLVTMTNSIVLTYCPKCELEGSTSAPPSPGHTTVYTTVYSSLCSTGLVPVTYTVTESCSEATPTWAHTATDDHVPQGFTVTVKDCHVCDKTPVPVTITEPCQGGCGKPTPPPATGAPAPTPSGDNVKQIPDGQVQAPGPSGGSGGNGSPAPSGGNGGGSGSPAPSGGDSGSPAPSGGASTPGSGTPSNNGSQRPPASGGDSPAAPGGSPSNGANAPYPTGNTTETEGCPGPQCAKPSSGGAATTGVESYTGGANAISFGFVSSLCMATVVAALAFAL
jgi:hypothetical protein